MKTMLRQPVRIETQTEEGAPFASYVYLEENVKSHHSRAVDDAIVLDFGEDGRLLGVEVLEFDDRAIASLNECLNEHGVAALGRGDLIALENGE